MKKFLTVFLTVVFLLAAGGYTILCAVADTKHILPGTTVNGIDISFMTSQTAADTLREKSVSNPDAVQITVALDGKNYTAPVGDAFELDYENTAAKALEKNPQEFWLRGSAWLQALLLGNQIEDPPFITDTEALYSALSSAGFPDMDAYLRQPYKIQGDRLIFNAGAVPQKIDRETLIQDISRAFQTGKYRDVIPCPLTPSGKTDLEQIYQEVHRDPVNATLDPENKYTIVEGKEGIDFDKKLAESAFESAKNGEETFVELFYPEPEVNAQTLKKRMFTDILSSYTTKVSGTANCVSNIRLAAKKCNGIILPSGYEFSFNKTVGEQTAATGFKTADAILDGKIIQAYGGGICQVSTTIFAAAIYANLDILEHWNHDYISSYIEAGMDAAVAWDVLDMRIANSSPYPVKIDVRCTDENLTVTLLGTKTDDAVVEVETVVLENSPPHTLEIETYRKVYTENKRHVFREKVAYSSYVQ